MIVNIARDQQPAVLPAPLNPYRDGTFLYRVFFEGETRDVYARNPARAKVIAEQAQRLTNAPKLARRAFAVRLVDPSTNQSYPTAEERQPTLFGPTQEQTRG